MQPKRTVRYVKEEDETRLIAAIRAAEEGNRAEVRVHLEGTCPIDDPLVRAGEIFRSLHMRRTVDSTGVLVYVAVKSRQTAVYADARVLQHHDPGALRLVVETIAVEAKKNQLVEGLIQGLERLGMLLRKWVPGHDSAGNEIPDEVSQS